MPTLRLSMWVLAMTALVAALLVFAPFAYAAVILDDREWWTDFYGRFR